MRLILDANILFAAIIKRGYTRDLIFFSNWIFYAPDFLLEEVYKYREAIISKGSIEAREFDDYVKGFFTRANIITIPFEEFKREMQFAEEILTDKKDAPYIALALVLGCPIWSNDKGLKKQNKIKVFTTEELTQTIFYQS